METSSDNETNANEEKMEPTPQNVGEEQGRKQKYKTIKIYKDDDNDDYRAVVHFEGGGTGVFSNLKPGIALLEAMMDDESIQKFRIDLVGLLKIGEFDAELQVPGLTEVDSNDVAKATEEEQDKSDKLGDLLEDLLLEECQLNADGLSYYAIAEVAVSHMTNGLNNPELDPIFITMHNRGLAIRVIVETTGEEGVVLEQVIHPRNLISQDVSHEEGILRKKLNAVIRDLDNAEKNQNK